MDFEWDEDKRRQVIERRGVDLLHAALIFDGEVLTKIDDRADYGEVRRISLGMVGGHGSGTNASSSCTPSGTGSRG